MLPQLNLQYDSRDTNLAHLLYVQGGWPLLYAFNYATLLPHSPFLKPQDRHPCHTAYREWCILLSQHRTLHKRPREVLCCNTMYVDVYLHD